MKLQHLLVAIAATAAWGGITPAISTAQTTIACSDPDKCVVARDCQAYNSQWCRCVPGGDWDTATGDDACHPTSSCVQATACAAFAELTPDLRVQRVAWMDEMAGPPSWTTTLYGDEGTVSLSFVPEHVSLETFAQLKGIQCGVAFSNNRVTEEEGS